MYRRILLAYDGSVEGRLALREGARLAQICQAEVFLLAVVDISSGMSMGEATVPGLVLAQQEAFEEVLNEGVRRLEAMGFRPRAKLGLGDPAEEIAAVAREIDADLVVIGHRQQGALARWLRGSVGMRLVNNLGCSLLVGRLEVADAELMPDRPSEAS